jgi:hypothetical protein
MRGTTVLLLLVYSLSARAQFNPDGHWHTGIGLTSATLNFKQNGSGGLAFPIRYDLVKSANSSLSLGTNFKVGTEDKYGILFPAVLGLVLLSGVSGQSPDFSDFNSSGNSNPGTSVCLFSDFPLLVQYNWGLGSSNLSNQRFGFYLGGGMSYTITGFTNSAGNETSTSFFGWVANAGFRFARNKGLDFATTIPFNNPIGPINNPIFYQLTFCFFFK